MEGAGLAARQQSAAQEPAPGSSEGGSVGAAQGLPAEPLPVDLKLWEPVPCGGGDVVVLVKLSEKYFQAISAEAGAQGVTFAEYYEQLQTFADENLWIR